MGGPDFEDYIFNVYKQVRNNTLYNTGKVTEKFKNDFFDKNTNITNTNIQNKLGQG